MASIFFIELQKKGEKMVSIAKKNEMTLIHCSDQTIMVHQNITDSTAKKGNDTNSIGFVGLPAA